MEEFHRHTAFEDVLERFFEDGIAANECGDQTDDTYLMKRLPKMEPDRYCRKRDKSNAEGFDDLKAMFLIAMMVVVMIATIMMFH